MAALILLAGVGASIIMPKDVLPEVNIPVVVWTYTGQDAPDMEQKITNHTETSISNNVNNICRMDSTSFLGSTMERICFQPSITIDPALSQVVALPTRCVSCCRPASSRR